MNDQDELTGTFVLVHPKLLNDPDEKKNQVGVITAADLENDNVVVSFSDGSQGLFSSDALLVLNDTEEIRRYADYDFNELFREDYYDIMEVCFLADIGNRRAAIELSQKSPMAQEYAMDRLDYALGLNQHKNIGR